MSGLMAFLMAICMAPLLGGAWRTVANRTLKSHRHFHRGAFAGGFLGLWLLVSTILVAVQQLSGTQGSIPVFAATAFVAAGWQLSPLRLRWASRCGFIPSCRLSGWKAAADHASAGWTYATRCGRDCWAPMVAMVAAPTMSLMLPVALVTLWEFRPGQNPFAADRRLAPAVAFGSIAFVSLATIAM